MFKMSALCALWVGVSACANVDKASSENLGVSVQEVTEGAGCEGLLNAIENCPNERACAALQELIDKHGCAPPPAACPCVEAPFPVGQIYCSGDGSPVTGVFFCWTVQADTCQVYGGNYTAEEQQAICDACRVQYPVEYGNCVAAGG